MAIFNPFLPSFTRSPYRAYASLRVEEPVHFSPTLQAWVVTSYAECEHILRDHARFSSSPLHASGLVAEMIRQQRRELPLGAVPTLLNSDPPVHTRLRGIVSTAFTPRVVQGLRGRIGAIAESLLDEVLDGAPASGAFDLVPALMQPLPVIVIAELLGVPPEDRALFKQWSNAIAATTNLFPAPDTFAAVKQATTELIAYLTTFIEARQREPREDLLTALVQAEDGGGRLSREELLAFCVLLLVAGHETTTNLIGNGVFALLGAPEGPEALDGLRAEPALIPNAVEEFLRYDSPVQAIPRVATEDIMLGGRAIERGAFVLLLVGAANRDPARFAEPDRLDIRREDTRHLSFGLGAHFCLGAPLARLEAQVVFEVLLRRLPGLHAAGEPERGGTFVLRGLQRLPVAG